MSKTERKMWREQTDVYSLFKDGDNTLTIWGIYRSEGESPNPTHQSHLEYVGECQDKNGELIKRRKRYDITEKIASEIITAIQRLAPHDDVRKRPEFSREHFVEATDEFVISLKHTPEKTLIVIHHDADGWKFETDERNRLGDAFSHAARR